MIMTPGANNDGYWNLANMAIQFENCADAADIMFPEYEHWLSLDNSCNHRGKQKGGLDMRVMNKTMGGAQPIMDPRIVPIDTVHKFDNGEWLIQPGQEQSLVFEETDIGPYYMNPMTRLARKQDEVTAMKEKTILKKQLIENLQRALDNPPENINNRLYAYLANLAERNGLPTKHTVATIWEGWVGKPKGMAQILVDCGLIDAQQPLSAYWKVHMHQMIGECTGFANALSSIEWLGNQRNWNIILSAKGYSDFAGFGIDYDWAVGKNDITRVPLTDRQTLDKFKEAFARSFSSEVLTLEVINVIDANSLLCP
jgi:hypothetical protein